MRTVRRLYFYAVAFISLEVILWGMIGLARSIACQATSFCGGSANLTQGLAAIIVGIPFFGVHWWASQRFARQDMEERASGVRAVFLYGLILATLIPIVQNLLSLLDRLALQAVNLSTSQAFFGPNQTWTDNLIAMLMNAVFAAYFWNILRGDWRVIDPQETYADIRRLYRHIWLVYSLAMVVAGVEQLLRFILNISPAGLDYPYRASGAHGIVLALVGVPLWYFTWKIIRDSLSQPPERDSALRLGMLYFLSLAGVITVLSSTGVVINVILAAIFGEAMSLADFMMKISLAVSIGVPLAGVWAYYGGWLRRAIAGSTDEVEQAGKRRVYAYILSAVGLAATFIGLSMLLSFVVDMAFNNLIWSSAFALRSQLAAALATLLVGFPLWWLSWRPMQAEALQAGNAGDHARRSIIRRVYLYLVLFVSVVGGMIVAVALLNILLRALFGNYEGNLLQQVLKDLELLFLFLGLGLYHGWVMRRDSRMASAALAEKHTLFPVWLIDPGDGLFGQVMAAALQKHASHVPASIKPVAQPLTGDPPRAVLIPSDLALDPPESLRKWMRSYHGERLVVPRDTPAQATDNTWRITGAALPLPAAAQQAAQLIRKMAEGQEIPPAKGPASGWMIFIYVLAGLFALQTLLLLVSLIGSLFFQF